MSGSQLCHQLACWFEIGLDAQSRFALGNRLRQPAGDLRQGICQVIVRFGEVGIEAQRRLVLRDRGRQPTGHMDESVSQEPRTRGLYSA